MDISLSEKMQMKELGVKKYSVLETEVDIAAGYGRELIKIEEI